MQREDYINMLTILERPETLSKGAAEAMATAVLYQNIKAHIQEMDADAKMVERKAIETEIKKESDE